MHIYYAYVFRTVYVKAIASYVYPLKINNVNILICTRHADEIKYLLLLEQILFN